MTFDSYYWHDARVSGAELERAREHLAATGDRAAFSLLLRSDDPVAVGIALDQYHHAEASTRHGTASAFAEYAGEVAARAREILRGHPSDLALGAEAGANHASALGALMNVAEPGDAALIVDALARTRTTNLRFAASLAAGAALERSASPDERLIAALEQIALDEAATRDERQAALSALGRARCPTATAALLGVTRVADLGLQATAALHLLDLEPRAHRACIEELVRTWPEDPPYPARDVLELLAEAAGEP